MKKIPWSNNQNIHLGNIELCVKNIVIRNFLTHGSFGLVYEIKYNNMDCVLKIIPIQRKDKLEILPLTNTTKISDFKKEMNMLEKLNEKQLIPKIYSYGICNIDYYYKDEKNKKIKIGYIISEKYDITIREYMNNLMNDFLVKKSENKLKRYIHELDVLDKKIRNDLELACVQLNIINDDTHCDNIMIKFDEKKNISHIKIIDWGSAKSFVNCSKHDIFYKPFTKKFLMVIKSKISKESQNILGLDKL